MSGVKEFVSRVEPDVVRCPTVKPGGLDVSMSSKQAAAARKSVVFQLSQETVRFRPFCGHFPSPSDTLCGQSRNNCDCGSSKKC